MISPAKTKVVIIGAGFAGVKVLSKLGRQLKNQAEIILINPTNYFLFTPLLHEVATGSLFPENIIIPLRPLVAKAGAQFLETRVKGIDLKKRQVTTVAGKLSYDYLVVAPGSTTNFFDIPGAVEHCLTLKDLNDAIVIKNRLIKMFERAATLPPTERAAALTFVVVGGGPTGVELVAEIADFMTSAFKGFYPESLTFATKIILIHKDQAILPQFSDQLRTKSFNRLSARRIDVRLNESVTEVKKDGLQLSGGEFIPSETVIWTAGVKAHSLDWEPEPLSVNGRLTVDQFLRLTDRPEVFVLGDMGASLDRHHKPLPMLAQVADQQATVVAKNIIRALNSKLPLPFHYHHRGSLVSLGSWFAIAEIGPFIFSGKFAWWLWRTIYLFKMPTWSKKLQIAIDWTIDLFTARDVSVLPCSSPARKKT